MAIALSPNTQLHHAAHNMGRAGVGIGGGIDSSAVLGSIPNDSRKKKNTVSEVYLSFCNPNDGHTVYCFGLMFRRLGIQLIRAIRIIYIRDFGFVHGAYPV